METLEYITHKRKMRSKIWRWKSIHYGER